MMSSLTVCGSPTEGEHLLRQYWYVVQYTVYRIRHFRVLGWRLQQEVVFNVLLYSYLPTEVCSSTAIWNRFRIPVVGTVCYSIPQYIFVQLEPCPSAVFVYCVLVYSM